MIHLTDMDELIQNVRSSYVKEYIAEALAAYRAGAHRAAVSIIWVAVCIDILEKIRELSLSGDAQATALEARIDKISPNDTRGMMDIENELIDIASTQLEFISSIEAKQLERLKEDRNFCVHPTFQKDGKHQNITPEAVRNHLVNACKFLLILPPTKGRILIETLNTLVFQNSFPEDSERAFQILSSENYLGRSKDLVSRNFFICLLKILLKDESSSPSLSYVKRICAAIAALHRIKPELIAATAKEQLPRLLPSVSEKRIRILFPVLNICSFLIKFVDAPSYIRLAEIMKVIPIEEYGILQIPASADHSPKIKSALLEIYTRIDPQDQRRILKSSTSYALKDQAIDTFCNVRSYDSAYDCGKNILLPYVPYFKHGDLLKIFEGVISNDQIRHAGRMSEIFSELYKETLERSILGNSEWKDLIERLPKRSDLYQALCDLTRLQPSKTQEDT
jgi:hypothetical protein